MTRLLAKSTSLLRIVLARLRFVAVFVLAAVVVGNFDSIVNHLDQWTRPATAPDALAAMPMSDVEYYCPMDGTIEDKPGACPECGMTLIKRTKADARALPFDVLARIQLTPQRLSLGNIAASPIGYADLTRQVQAFGVIDYDQGHVVDLSARLAGRADEVFVTSIGQMVKAGDPLYSLYSPDAFTALREYLQARKRAGDMASGAATDMMADAMSLAEAARQKLVLWGLTDEQLMGLAKAFDKNGQVPSHITIVSPASGVVTKKQLQPGGYVQVGDSPFALADLSRVWMNAKIYESDAAAVRKGQSVHITADAIPGTMFEGTIALVSYVLDPQTRTLDARIELPNAELLLKPGFFARASVDVDPMKHALCVDRSAIINTGAASYVFVESMTGVFDKKKVSLGPLIGQMYPIVEGLKAGDRVATRGAFLLDAEDHLNASPN